ncbi:hypothetical protein Hdeb2414_s0018g00525941 [Helianthus debilis subsp. tardiflorus]
MPRLNFQSYGTVGIGEPMGNRVLSGVHCLEVLAYLLPLCNEDTGPVTPALIFQGLHHGVLLQHEPLTHVTNERRLLSQRM